MSVHEKRAVDYAVHPLEPLTVEEINSAVEILRSDHGLEESHRFAAVTLHEPPKEKVLNFQNGEPVEREALITVLDKSDGSTYESVVSLTEGKTTRWEYLPDVHAPRLLEERGVEGDLAERLCKENPEFRAALEKRGVTNMDLVIVESWLAGSYSDYSEEFRKRRLVRPLTFVKMDPDDINSYAHPVENLVIYVDVDEEAVISVEDYGVVPIPQQRANYAPEDVGGTREDLKPLEITQPEGVSFEIEGHEIRWQKWRLRVSSTPQEGLVLHTISYNDDGRERPILYRASLSEMVVPYGDPAPVHARKNAFDAGENNIGHLVNSLELGCDCLGEIRYFDAIFADSDGRPFTIKDAVCLHEEDFGLLWKHHDAHSGTTEVRRSRRLVVSSIYTVANYEYGIYWYFYQDGTIELEVKLTGILSTGAVKPGEKPEYGQLLNADGLYAPNHQHIFNFRLDLDIDGQSNSLYELHAETAPPDPEKNPLGNAFYTKSTLLSTESEAKQNIDPLSGRHWVMVNPSSLNGVGEPVGYKLIPYNSSVPPVVRQEADVLTRGEFATKSLWATPYEPTELHAAGKYPYQHPGGAGLTEWTRDDRSIEEEDIVLWYTFASHHAPRLEDWPIMPVQYAGFKLEPFGFFDRSPALDVPRPDSNGHCHHT